MPMSYTHTAIRDEEIPRASVPVFQHTLQTYASETNKVISVWGEFQPEHLYFHPHKRSSSVAEIFKHQILSERRFFGEFLGTEEPLATEVLPASPTIDAFVSRLRELALPRLHFLAGRAEAWWLEEVPFFDVRRERIWIFWRRILHTAHHRTQLAVYLRLLDRRVPPIYGPTADATWEGADPTQSIESAGRK
jgi:uncharacterized damage-inducible protein DinB